MHLLLVGYLSVMPEPIRHFMSLSLPAGHLLRASHAEDLFVSFDLRHYCRGR
jgi:hypothetical protein